MAIATERYVRAAQLADVQAAGCLVVHLEGYTLALFTDGEKAYAVDNRCPHMGFPLHRGTLKDGILTCHWHHARFDLESGGTFDQWADDVRTFPVEVRDGEVLVDLTARVDPKWWLEKAKPLEESLPGVKSVTGYGRQFGLGQDVYDLEFWTELDSYGAFDRWDDAIDANWDTMLPVWTEGEEYLEFGPARLVGDWPESGLPPTGA